MLSSVPAAEVRAPWPIEPPSAGRYVARVYPFGGSAPIPLSISSWQGTVHAAQSGFLQAQVPVPDPDAIASVMAAIEQGAAVLAIYRVDALSGAERWQRMYAVPLQQWYLNEGPQSRTLTLSGRSLSQSFPLEVAQVTARGARTRMTAMSGSSLRANLDPRVYPGVVLVDDSEITVRFVNWYASSADEWMQVGN